MNIFSLIKNSKQYKYLFLIFILLLIELRFIKIKKLSILHSDHWIVMNAYNPPCLSLIKSLNYLKDWKIVVISINNKIDKKWKELNYSNKLVYISLKDQMRLGYHISKYLAINSYSRKNIGYLYAIQHGAKEIFEADEDIVISELNSFNFNLSNNIIYFAIRNDSRMINPYIHFGERNIWPRGFRLSDIGHQHHNMFYTLNGSNLLLTPLIYQGLINGVPDTDSIFQKTKPSFEINFTLNKPFIYFPGNFVPINSKNTKYLYDIFPFLALFSTLSKNLSDILRGYILQYFAWRQNGCVVFHSSKNSRLRNNISKNSILIEEKNLFYNIDKYLYIININIKSNSKMKVVDRLYSIIENLINFGFLGTKDLKMYKAYLDDLSNIGYIYSSIFENKFNYDYKGYINSYTEFNSYIPNKPYEFLGKNKKNIKIFFHKNSLKQYKNILLIINYNLKGFEYINNYILALYENNFPNFVFIMPSETTNRSNTILCKESYRGYFSYICLEKVFLKYPNYTGYLYTNDDDFMKIWELDNLNFNIPWLYQFNNINKNWFHYRNCIRIHNIINRNPNWKANLTTFLGYYNIPTTVADFYYLPNYIVPQFCKILKEFYKSRIFLECAVPTTLGIILSKEYQIIHFSGLWGKDRNNVIEYLHKKYNQITIHPIKFSKIKYRNSVNSYDYFIKAKEF